ncbi:hypothetical protein KDH_66730 [Dictyobacter sp. S3.2.2.5]|uniref:Tetratricopeptide repeat protein n=1 Tax=Dictyobacter halimunensis TaxID=3026934 RepID=A0ABQ6G009_9CHLR|nr:hypothetical protein KDH_66730 [Dictyobacter sp. S3.2.2.5]
MLDEVLLLQLGQVRQTWAKGQLKEAYDRYEVLLEEYPEHPTILREYGHALFMEYGDLEKSALLLERALEQEPDSIITLQCLCLLYSWGYGHGYAAAGPLYRRLIALAPTDKQICVNAYLGIGTMRGAPGCSLNPQESRDAFQMATEIDPEYVNAWLNLTTLCCELRDWPAAQIAATRAEALCRQQGHSTSYAQKLLDHINRQEPLKNRSYYNGTYLNFRWPNIPLE